MRSEDGGVKPWKCREATDINPEPRKRELERSQPEEVSSRGFFPWKLRQPGLICHRSDFSLGRAGGNTDPAASAEAATNVVGSTSVDFSEHGEKETPLGSPLGDLGGLIGKRFLEVALHSQTTGIGKPNAIFPLPTSRDLLASFFLRRLRRRNWIGFFSLCLALNSYWGGPLLGEREVSVLQGRIL